MPVVIDLRKLGEKTDVQRDLFPGEQGFFQIGAENIFVLARHLPVFRSVNTGDLHAAVAFAVIIRRRGIDGRNGLIGGAFPIGVGIHVEFEGGNFVFRRILVFHLHHRGQRGGFGHVFCGNFVRARAARGFFTARRAESERDETHCRKQKTKNAFHKKITPKMY